MGKSILFLACVGLLAGLARGQVPPPNPLGDQLQRDNRLRQLQQMEFDERERVDTDVPIGQRALIDYGGYFSFNYLSADDSLHNNHGLRQYELVAYLRVNLDNANEFFFRGRTDYNDYNPGDSFDGHGSRLINPDLDRGYWRFDLQKEQAAYGGGAGTLKFDVELGRDLAYWANGLVLTEVLDGGYFDLGSGGFNLHVQAGITPTRTVDIDTSRPRYESNTRRFFYGAMATQQIGDHQPFLYVLNELDMNNYDVLDTGPITTHYDYNPTYVGLGSTGNLGDRVKYGVEAAYEGGTGLSNSFQIAPGGGLLPVRQTKDVLAAWAVDGRLDYLVPGPHQTRYSAEFIMASGDHDRGTSTSTFNGNAPHTKDNGFNAFGLLNTGLAFSPEVSNLMVGRIGASTFPLPDNGVLRRLQVGTDLFVFGKLWTHAPIDEPTDTQRFLGMEPDLYLNWDITSDVTLALRYGVFFPDSGAFASDAVRQFFYGGITFAF